MSYRCMGKRGVGLRCKLTVDKEGGYCNWHVEQEVKKSPCRCFLPNGSACLYPAVKNDLCEYHQSAHSCQGKTILGDSCLKAISSGRYCWNCASQQEVIMKGVKEKTDEYRGFLMKEGTPITPAMKSVPVVMASQIKIPSSLKKIEIEKPADCCICMEPMVGKTSSDKYRALSCCHYFHDLCLSGLSKMECPVCRRVIPPRDVPKWVAERISVNMAESEKQKEQDQEAASAQFVQTVLRQQILEMNSSEEEDFNQRLQSGAEIGLVRDTDSQGNARVGIVFLE